VTGRSLAHLALPLVVALVACTETPNAQPSPATAGSAGRASVAPTAVATPDNARKIVVASDAADGGDGSDAKPFKTIPAAQAAVRAALVADRRQSFRITLRSGRYPLDAPLRFDEKDSPADGYALTISGPADASAVIVGGRRATEWEAQPNGVYRTRLPAGVTPAALFENGAHAMKARVPATGYSRVKAEVAAANTTQFVYGDGDLPAGLDAASAEVYVWSGDGYDWEPDLIPVTGIDATSRTITLSQPAAYPIRAGDRYYVQGPRALLTQAGQFAVDAKDGFLYYRPRTGPIDRQEIWIPTVPRIIDVRGGSPDTPARNIAFERLTLTVSDFVRQARAFSPGRDNAAVHLESATGVAIRSVKIQAVAGSGVVLRGSAQKNVVTGSLIEDVGVHGVWFQGPALGAPHVNTANEVSNVLIRRGGRIMGSGSGIKLENSGENLLANDRISDMPRYGISLKAQAIYNMAPSYNGVAVTWDNHWDFLHTRANVIRGNDISSVLTDSQDAGGIEMYGAGKGNVIENNRVHDLSTGIPTGEANGIYLDDGSDYNIVRNNIVFGITGARTTAAFVKGVYNEVSNNIFINSGGGAALGSYRLFEKSRHDHLTIARNIFYSAATPDIYWFRDWSDDRISEARSNVFFQAGGQYSVRFAFAGKRISLDEWRSTYGLDRDSVTADPLFVNAATGDYTVRAGSPALGLGFVNIDQTKIGLAADFPFGP